MLAARVFLADSEVARRFRWKIHVYEDDAELLLSRADWDAIKQTLRYVRAGSAYDGMLVQDLGFQNVIKDQLSHEYYQYLADACGYYSDTQNWNAAEALHYLIGEQNPPPVNTGRSPEDTTSSSPPWQGLVMTASPGRRFGSRTNWSLSGRAASGVTSSFYTIRLPALSGPLKLIE